MRLCFVVQRYGREVNGGAESLCRAVAEHLAKYLAVDVVTTCAVDYVTWKNEYAPGVETHGGVTVRRFPVDHERDIAGFDAISGAVLCRPHSYEDEVAWMKMQGPYSTPLLAFLAEHRDTYDAFVFFTYLYCTTFFGLPLVVGRALLLPAAHDEPPIYLSIFDDLFSLPGALLYSTEEEKRFVTSKFHTDAIPSAVIGTGVDVPDGVDPSAFERKYGLGRFIVYVGRIDESKGCKELFAYFLRYRAETDAPIKLVLIGKAVMEVPDDPAIVPLGFVSDQEKYGGILASEVLVMPSLFESLSMVLLEAWQCGRPVLANGNCEVLKGQCSRSNAGLWYRNYDEFRACLDLLLGNKKLRDLMGQEGKKFVEKNYTWEIVEKKYLDCLGRFCRS